VCRSRFALRRRSRGYKIRVEALCLGNARVLVCGYQGYNYDGLLRKNVLDETTNNNDGGTTRRIRRARSAADSSWRRRVAQRSAPDPARPTVPVLPTLIPTGGEIAYGADYSAVRYAQCWEDTELMLAGLSLQANDVCITVASASDNVLALLTESPAKIFAVDINPAQIALLELRVAAYRVLSYHDLLVFMGSRRGQQRLPLYQACRGYLSRHAKAYWDERPEDIARGIGSAGKFEKIITALRSCFVPLAHDRRVIDNLLQPRSRTERREFFERTWDTPLRRLLVRFFLPRLVEARAGKPLSFFPKFAGEDSKKITERTKRLLVDMDPLQNPYLHWLLTGTHGEVLPFALREENVTTIRKNLDRLEWRLCAVEDVLNELSDRSIDRFYLSDLFEYMAEPAYHTMLHRLARVGRRGGRIMYWNTLRRRRRPPMMADMLFPLSELSEALRRRDHLFFYHDLVIEEII
jgi:S-adenosylmethionine-diacylglycerol 3-amino-3-carboxypropyl transferase